MKETAEPPKMQSPRFVRQAIAEALKVVAKEIKAADAAHQAAGLTLDDEPSPESAVIFERIPELVVKSLEKSVEGWSIAELRLYSANELRRGVDQVMRGMAEIASNKRDLSVLTDGIMETVDLYTNLPGPDDAP